jgi:hypothetical protein
LLHSTNDLFEVLYKDSWFNLDCSEKYSGGGKFLS